MDALVLPPPMQLLIYLLYGAVFGYIGEVLAGRPMPLHFVGSTLVAALGAWAAVDLLKLHLGGEIVYQQVPLLSAGVGALFATLLWVLLWRGRGRRRYRLIVGCICCKHPH
jgi:uncharacterized membrane protein YeaQ/YmgE (transglycosylase-associated protein family)